MTDPLYRQIADDIRTKIKSGDLAHGDQLPTELVLMDQHNASRNTVRDAVKLLTTLGLIETRPGRGTFVLGKIDPYVTILTGEPDKGGDEEGPVYAKGAPGAGHGPRRLAITVPRLEIQKAAGAGAEELQVSDDTTVVSRHQQRYIDDTPWSLQTSFYPMILALQGADRLLQAESIDEGAVKYLRDRLGLKQAGYRDTITVRAPDQGEAAFFKLPDDGRVAVFEIRRTAFDDHEKPFRLTVSVYPTDRNQFAVEVGDVADVANVANVAKAPAAAEASRRGGSP